MAAKRPIADSHSPDSSCDTQPEAEPGHGGKERANALFVQCPPHITERALIRRLDWRLLPIICVIYVMAFLDR